MNRFEVKTGMVALLLVVLTASPAWARGFGGFRGGGGFGGGFRGGGCFNGGYRGGFGGGGGFAGGYHGGGAYRGYAGYGAGRSGSGFRSFDNSRFNSYGGYRASGFDRSGFDRGGFNRSNVVHYPGSGGLQIGQREIHPGQGITRTDFGSGNFSGGRTFNRSTASLPGLGMSRPGAGGSGTRFNPNTSRPGAGGSGTRFNQGSIQDRHNDLNNRFNDLNQHGNDSGWHHQQWNGPNGGDINHVGFWGPNGYWGHTGVHGANGGYWGHSGGVTPYGAWGHTTGIGPNGAVWGHGGAIGPNGAFGYAGYAGPAGHWSRNWGGWYNGYGPAWGYGRWNYLWNQYPVAMAFGATMWGLNAVNATYGVSDYVNPYCDGPVYVDGQPVVSYTQPIVGDPAYEAQQAAAQPDATPTAENPPAADPSLDDPLTETFDLARSAFFDEKYEEALKQVDQALVKAPRDAAINEFRSLCLFALGRYRDSAANIHAVLDAGPGWDWTTMIGLYDNPAAYTSQLRKLEKYVKDNPKSADSRFLLAYHYITADHKVDAVSLLKSVVALEPRDKLAADLVKMYSPAPTDSASAPNTPAPDFEKSAYPLEKLQGDWTASDGKNEFELTLGKDDAFTWKFTQDGKTQSVSGAYTVRGKNLVMQPNTGGVMLSTIALETDQTLTFTPVGEKRTLTFTK